MITKGEDTGKRFLSKDGTRSSIIYRWHCSDCGGHHDSYYKKKCKCDTKRERKGKSRIFTCKYCGRLAVVPKKYTRSQVKFCHGGNCSKAYRKMAMYKRKLLKPQKPEPVRRVLDKAISKHAPVKQKVNHKGFSHFLNNDDMIYDSRVAHMMGKR